MTPGGGVEQVRFPMIDGGDDVGSGEFTRLSTAATGARRVFAAIEWTIGDGSSASLSYVNFGLDHGIARKSVSPSLKLLDHLGLIDIEPGPRLVNIFRFSNRWRTIDEVEAVRLAALAREVKPLEASKSGGSRSG
jgi:hypothetical protein